VPVVRVVLNRIEGFPSHYIRLIPAPVSGHSTAAVLPNGTLTLNNVIIALHVGAEAWDASGRMLFYTEAPPITAPMTPEPLYGVSAATGRRILYGMSADPWRLSPVGENGMLFDHNGTLAVASGLSGQTMLTSVPLPGGTDSSFPFTDWAFKGSTLWYVAVLSPSGVIRIDQLHVSGGASIRATAIATLEGTVPGSRNGWGAWDGEGAAFLYATQSTQMIPAIREWTRDASTTIIYGRQRGQYLIVGWLIRVRDAFLVDVVPMGTARQSGRFEIINTKGVVVQTLWQGGFGGVFGRDQKSVTFEAGAQNGPPQLWDATLQWLA
jgi:hypothetical protein